MTQNFAYYIYVYGHLLILTYTVQNNALFRCDIKQFLFPVLLYMYN